MLSMLSQRSMKSWALGLAATLTAFAAFPACSREEAKAPASSEAATSARSGTESEGVKTYVIGVIAKSQSNPVFQAARVGAEAAAKDLEKEHGVKVQINWRTPNNEDAQQQAQFLEQLASQGVNGIAISCTDAKLLTGAINGAADKGVVVVTFDSDAPDSKRLAYYGVDDVEAGKAVMVELARVMGEKGVVAVLAGNQNAPNLQRRVQGVREQAKAYPGISIKDVYYHPEQATDAAAKMQQVQTSNPDVSGWALVGGWPLYTDNALDGIYQQAKVVSMDPLPLPLEYVKKGQVQALVGQPYYGWGYESVKMIFNKVHANQDPPKVINTAPLDIVTAENVAKFEGQWNQWLGKK